MFNKKLKKRLEQLEIMLGFVYLDGDYEDLEYGCVVNQRKRIQQLEEDESEEQKQKRFRKIANI